MSAHNETQRPVGGRRSSPLAAAPPPESWPWRLAVFLGYLVLGVVFTWPMALHFQSGVIQKGAIPVDAGQGIWNLWWTQQSLAQGQNPYFTRYLFFPERVDLFWQTLSLPNGLLVLPVMALFGPLAGFNAVTLLSFGLGGYFTYRLARALLDDRLAALLAGFIFACSPYHMQRILGGSLELIAVQWMPLYLLMLMRALHRRTVLSVLSAAAVLLITTLASQYYGLFSAVYTLFHAGLAVVVLRGKELGERKELGSQSSQSSRNSQSSQSSQSSPSSPGFLASPRLHILFSAAGVLLVWALALLPFVWPLGALNTNVLLNWYDRQTYHAAALLDLLAPNVLHPLWGGAATAWLNMLHPIGVEVGATLGLAVALLAAVALWRRWREAWPWLLLALLMFVFALGPELKISGKLTGIPLPFLLLDLAGPFRNSSRPSLFVALMLLPVALLAGYGLQALRERTADDRRQTADDEIDIHVHRPSSIVRLFLALAVLLEYAVAPWAILTPRVAPLYNALNGVPAPGALLELPPLNDASQYMINQLCHGRPLGGGYLARTHDYRAVAYASALRDLWYGFDPVPDIVAPDPAAELANLGVGFVALNLERVQPDVADRLRRQLPAPGLALYAADAQHEIYQVDPAAARPLLLPAADEWFAPEEATADAGQSRRIWRWMGDRASLRLLAASPRDTLLSFAVTAYQSPRPLTVLLDERPLFAYTVPSGAFATMTLLVPAGTHTLTFASTAADAPEGRRISLALSNVTLHNTHAPVSARIPLPFTPLPTLPGLDGPPCAR